MLDPTPSVLPAAAMLEAYKHGVASQDVSDLMELAYAPDGKCWGEWMEDEVMRLFWSAGHESESLPRWVEAERYGDIPMGGRSTNHAESHAEHGLSVARLLDGSDDYEWHMGHFGAMDRPVVRVAGWLHHERGADGEPLLVSAEVA